MAHETKVVMANMSGRGGISQNAYCLSIALAECPIELIYLTTSPYEFNGHPHPFMVKKVFQPLYNKSSILAKSLAHIKNIAVLKRQMDLHRPHICHMHEIKIPTLDLALVRWCHRNGVQVVYTAHDILHPERLSRSGARARFYREVDGVIANAKENRDQILRAFQSDPQKIKVIIPGSLMPNGQLALIARMEKTISRRNLGIDDTAPTLLFFGHIREYKGLDVLLHAMASLQKEVSNVNLIIAGEPVEDFTKYEEIISCCAYPDHIHLHLRYIPEDEMRDFFSAADIVVLPYRRIYQSGVVPVAYAHGRPIIASSVGGLSEVIEEGKSGLLVPPNDPVALAEAIHRMINDPKSLKRMGNFARELLDQKYSWRNIAEQTFELYKQVLAPQLGN